MKKLIKKIGPKITPKNVLKILLAASAVVALAIILPHFALAAGGNPAPADTSSPNINEMYREILNVAVLTMGVLERIIWPVLLLIGGLMKSDILFGAGMEERMLSIWVQIRNLVNILFVLILLGIALYNVVGGPKQEFQLKQILPKFVIALIAVNFSYIAVKLVVDSVNVVTTAIFALPLTIDKEKLGKIPINEPGSDFQKQICEGLYTKDDYDQMLKNAGDSALCEPGAFLKPQIAPLFEYFNSSNAATVMAIQLQNVSGLPKVADLAKLTIKDLLSDVIFSIVMFIIYSTAFVALFVILLVRLVVLWVVMVLSPLMVLSYAFPGITKQAGGADGLKEKFVKTAIAPIPIALFMTIGYIMIKGLKDIKLGGAIFGVTGTSAGIPVSGMSTFQDLIASVGTAAVVWMGVFTAATGTYAENAVKKIKDTVGGVGKFVAGAIQYAPLFQLKTAGGEAAKVSLASIGALPEEMKAAQRREAMKGTTLLMGGMKAGDYVRAQQAIRDATDKEGIQNGLYWAGRGYGQGDPGKNNLKDLGDRITKRNLTNELNWDVKIKDAKGNPMTPAQAVEAMRTGKDIDQESFELWRERNLPKTPPKKPAEEKPIEAKPGEAPAMGTEKADSLAGLAAGAHGAALTPDESKKIEVYKKAKDKGKALEDEGLRKALGKVQEAAAGGHEMRSKVNRATDLEDIQEAINTRRSQLTNMNETQQNEIIRSELNYQTAFDKIHEQTGGTDTVVGEENKKIVFTPPTPTETPPAAPAKAAPPAGGTPAATPAAKPTPPPAPPPAAPPPPPSDTGKTGQ